MEWRGMDMVEEWELDCAQCGSKDIARRFALVPVLSRNLGKRYIAWAEIHLCASCGNFYFYDWDWLREPEGEHGSDG